MIDILFIVVLIAVGLAVTIWFGLLVVGLVLEAIPDVFDAWDDLKSWRRSRKK